AMPLSTVTRSCGSSDSATTGIDAVVGACAGMGCGFAGADVVRATGVVDGALSGAGAGAVVDAGSVMASGIWASPPSWDLGATASAGAGGAGVLSAAGSAAGALSAGAGALSGALSAGAGA